MNRSISVSKLKARLSQYVRDVQRGSEIQVILRGKPVARLVGVHGLAGNGNERRERLVALGILRPGSGHLRRVAALRPLVLEGLTLRDAVNDDRADRI